MKHKRLLSALFLLIVAGCATDTMNRSRTAFLKNTTAVAAYPDAGVVVIGCRIYQNEKCAGLFEFSQRTQGWSGCSEGVNNPHFIIRTEASQDLCNQKLQEAGAKAYRQFPVKDAVKMLKSGNVSEENFLDGTPVMVSLRWNEGDKLIEVPFEKCFQEKTVLGNGKEILKPFTPHFVYHGAGLLNKDTNYGCLVCQQDCSGGLICNNQAPCCKPVPKLKPDWNVLPPKGTLVNLIIYILK